MTITVASKTSCASCATTSSDREAVRAAFSALHVAHAEAEEKYVYPALRKKSSVTEHEAEHGEEEHAEGNEALLAVLECASTDTQKFEDAVEELAKVVNHHLTEEELTILNPAREDVSEQVKAELGEKFATERNKQIDDDCGCDHQRPPDRQGSPRRRTAARRGLASEHEAPSFGARRAGLAHRRDRAGLRGRGRWALPVHGGPTTSRSCSRS